LIATHTERCTSGVGASREVTGDGRAVRSAGGVEPVAADRGVAWGRARSNVSRDATRGPFFPPSAPSARRQPTPAPRGAALPTAGLAREGEAAPDAGPPRWGGRMPPPEELPGPRCLVAASFLPASSSVLAATPSSCYLSSSP
jgi:hypothetical protein